MNAKAVGMTALIALAAVALATRVTPIRNVVFAVPASPAIAKK